MLELRHVCKRFKRSPAVDDVSFSARAGEITGYLGPNGSGKSTTMKMITGLMETDLGRDPVPGRAHRARLDRLQAAHGLRPRRAAPLFASERSRVSDDGRLNCAICPQNRRADRIDGLLRLFSLHGDRHAAICGLLERHAPESSALGGAAAQSRPYSCWTSLFPASTWVPALVLRSLIQELASRGKVVLFSSHELETVERVCSHVVILNRGKIVADDSIERLRTLMAAAHARRHLLAACRGTGHRGDFARDCGSDSGMRSAAMTKLQFRVLYRQFLFRMVDLEVLSAHALGDANKLLGQFAASCLSRQAC